MDIHSPLGDADPLAASDPTSTRQSGRVHTQRVRRMFGGRAELRSRPFRVLSPHDINNSGYPAADEHYDDAHDGATRLDIDFVAPTGPTPPAPTTTQPPAPSGVSAEQIAEVYKITVCEENPGGWFYSGSAYPDSV